MAKRMKSKIQPAVMKLRFSLTDRGDPITQNTFKSFFIDLSQCASIVNRRFYRQGLNWAVSDFTLRTPVASSIVVQKLPNTWVTSNAWEKSFRVWQNMIKNATDESGMKSIKGKFLDFKVFADKNHHRIGVGDNLLPVSYDYDDTAGAQTVTTTTAVAGEWTMSDITIPSTSAAGAITDYELIMVGSNDPGAGASGKDAKSVIQGYADSRALPYDEDPNVPADASLNWMMSIFNEGTLQDNAVINMLESNGDQTPYPIEGAGATDTMYPGGETQLPDLETHAFETVTSTTIGGMTRFAGGNFPCGLIAVHFNPTGNSATAELELNLVPGKHRGYLAEPMTEM